MKRYIVISDTHRPMMLGDYGDCPRGGVLMTGDYGHLFRSRRSAKRAVERTANYARSRKLAWPVHKFVIERVVEP